MRAVWSFWSKPFRAYKGRIWHTERHHLLAWGLSLRQASRYFDETVLVTDTYGKALLVDQLGLQFTHVTTDLDALRDADTGWWALGKLAAYRLQDQPFVHLDTDVFLWKPLPAALLDAPVFAQCPERHPMENAYCGPREVQQLFERFGREVPLEWAWALERVTDTFREENCGMVGCNNVAFMRHFAGQALDMALNPANAALWETLAEKSGYNMVLEQYQLAACVDYHRYDPASKFPGVHIEYLFPSWAASYDEERAARAGYTHLLGDAKTNPEIAWRLEQRVQREDANFYQHCLRMEERL